MSVETIVCWCDITKTVLTRISYIPMVINNLKNLHLCIIIVPYWH